MAGSMGNAMFGGGGRNASVGMLLELVQTRPAVRLREAVNSRRAVGVHAGMYARLGHQLATRAPMAPVRVARLPHERGRD
eukprot:5021704-Lingulodinium_polyedra.AAC.1